MRTVLSPWHLKTTATLPTVYNGLGSDVYSRTAKERLRLLYESTIASTLQPAVDPAAPDTTKIMPAIAKFWLRRGANRFDEDSFKWSIGDDALQAAGPPATRMVEGLSPGRAMMDLVRKFRDMRILKVYARSNPLSIYTADSDSELSKQGPGSPGRAPVSTDSIDASNMYRAGSDQQGTAQR
jgi:hypothetical protein